MSAIIIICILYRPQSRYHKGVYDGNLFRLHWIFTVVTLLIFFLQTATNILGFLFDANATARPIFFKYLFEKKKH